MFEWPTKIELFPNLGWVCVYLRVQTESLRELLGIIEPPLTNQRGQPLLRQCLHQLPHDHPITLQLSVVHTVLEGVHVIVTTRTSIHVHVHS